MEDATDLTQLSVRDLAERLSSREPVPGGGSAAAIVGALGAALVAMVAELTIGRPDAADHDDALRRLLDEALTHRDLLLSLSQEDAAAYGAVVRARRLPKTSDPERELRQAEMRRATRHAADVPLRTARSAATVLELAQQIAPIGNVNAASDAGVAAQLASAAVRGAILNVRINLPYLPEDDQLRLAADGAIPELEQRTSQVERATVEQVARRMQPS